MGEVNGSPLSRLVILLIAVLVMCKVTCGLRRSRIGLEATVELLEHLVWSIVVNRITSWKSVKVQQKENKQTNAVTTQGNRYGYFGHIRD